MRADAYRKVLEDGDVEAMRRVWKQIAPHLAQPENLEQAEIMLHHARTQTASVTLEKRAYSHRWLTERSLPSGLPDELRPKAERMYPVVVEGVGVSVNFRSAYMAPAATEVRSAMNVAIEHCYADKRTDPEFVKAQMQEAKDRTMRALFGKLPAKGGR